MTWKQYYVYILYTFTTWKLYCRIVNTVHTSGSVQRDFLVSTLSFKIVCVALYNFASLVPDSVNSLIVYSQMASLSLII